MGKGERFMHKYSAMCRIYYKARKSQFIGQLCQLYSTKCKAVDTEHFKEK